MIDDCCGTDVVSVKVADSFHLDFRSLSRNGLPKTYRKVYQEPTDINLKSSTVSTVTPLRWRSLLNIFQLSTTSLWNTDVLPRLYQESTKSLPKVYSLFSFSLALKVPAVLRRSCTAISNNRSWVDVYSAADHFLQTLGRVLEDVTCVFFYLLTTRF